MSFDDSFFDDVEFYEKKFHLKSDRKTRRNRKIRVMGGAESDVMIEPVAREGEFQSTYTPARYESGWLMSSLQSFYDQQLIDDVLALVKGGKEANVYRCAAHPTLGVDWLAAKVYRPRMFRNLRNDKMYREGRDILTPEGRPVKKNDHRLMRALGKKTAFGVQVSHTSWLMYEYTTLERLYQAGAAVPKPIASAENAILMGYLGDADLAAPALSEIRLDREEAVTLFPEVLRNVDLMLQHGLIHGDLSAYNLLYWEGRLTLIDFPQVTDSRTNRNAYAILQRDVTRICEYFARQGVASDPGAITRDLWDRYVRTPPGHLDTDALDDADPDDESFTD